MVENCPRLPEPPATTSEGNQSASVRRYIAAGDLEAVRLRRRTIRIKTDSLDRLIDAHRVKVWRP